MVSNKGFVSIPLVVGLAVIVGVVSVFFVKKDDQVTEEFCEAVVENQLNLPSGTLDLTPSSKE